jgi:predicted phosphodiesterase
MIRPMTMPRSVLLAGLLAAMPGMVGEAFGHDGPDPVAHWLIHPARLADGRLDARLGPDLAIRGEPQLVADDFGYSLRLDADDLLSAAEPSVGDRPALPSGLLTISAWVAVDEPSRRGNLVGSMRDGRGWRLGFDDRSFTFALGAGDQEGDDARPTVLASRTTYEPGRLYHVAATYDGKEMRLYVNGALDATSAGQAGPIGYAEGEPLAFGTVEQGEDGRTLARIREVAIYDLVALPRWVEHEFEHARELVAIAPALAYPEDLAFVVTPYLQFVTEEGITVCWETSRPGTSVVRWGETGELPMTATVEGTRTLHHVRLEGLEAQSPYFYAVETTDEEGGQVVRSELSSFQTANREGSPYAFAVISDTQSNPDKLERIAELAWSQRPNFVLIPGDLVSTGTTKEHWTGHFFPNMNPLISRVAFFPVLGNHERNARHYYDYMTLPEPEYYYDFRYGNAHFFVVDSNKEVGPGSEQYSWLERVLPESDATWKFVTYHHPAYSSDEDDYGDLWEGERSSHGDARIRELTPLLERNGVDIVWNGHIHSYERTWPLREGEVVERDGTIYMITGGGGGNLETPGPIKPVFQNNVRHGHHYTLVAINGGTLELKAFDIEGRLFDTLTITKE